MGLVKHAEYEMKKAGFYDKDADYGGMIPEAVMKLIKVHSEEGHSGGSHWLTLRIFNKLVNFKTLTPITSNPDEWMKVDENIGGPGLWQNTRQSSVFSVDNLKSWYDIDDPKKRNWPRNKLTKFERFKKLIRLIK